MQLTLQFKATHQKCKAWVAQVQRGGPHRERDSTVEVLFTQVTLNAIF